MRQWPAVAITRRPVVMASLGRVYGQADAEADSTFLVSDPGRSHKESRLISAVTFQESILTILPASVFLALAGPRAMYLFRTKDRTRKRTTYTPKLVRLPIFCVQVDVGTKRCR